MESDLWLLYALMLKSRLFEEAIAKLWHDGVILGEMHLGTGEEGIIAGIVSQLRDGDAIALDHRATAAMLMRGVDPAAILRECMGRSDGLCGGMGGHMHLFSKEHLAASSGIVGAEGPAAAGFALAAQYLHPGKIAVAFFGDGAINQGMLMESMNLAAAWDLPVLFVCKDDNWAIATKSDKLTGASLEERARGFGIPAAKVDGRDVGAVWVAARAAIQRARAGRGPSFLHATCVHFEGHFLGFQLLRTTRDPIHEIPGMSKQLARSLLRRKGASVPDRVLGVSGVLGALVATLRDPRGDTKNDPIRRLRKRLRSDPERLRELEDRLQRQVTEVVAAAQAEVSA